MYEFSTAVFQNFLFKSYSTKIVQLQYLVIFKT